MYQNPIELHLIALGRPPCVTLLMTEASSQALMAMPRELQHTAYARITQSRRAGASISQFRSATTAV